MTVAPPAADSSLSARQSLAHGPLSTALLHIERALRGTGDWAEAHRVLAATGPLIEGRDAGLFLGAPAMAFALHLAADGTERYAGALHTLDQVVAEHTRARLAAAHDRIDAGRRPTFSEYDLLRGLTGIGALLLRRNPHGPELRGILDYLVRLTEPLTDRAGRTLPGWWVDHAPATDQSATPGGHANAGIAHGIAGPLALLCLAMRAGVHTRRQELAIRRVCQWLDDIRQCDSYGLRWPRWISHSGSTPVRPATPSWCYGTPGLVRAQQLAAIVLEDTDRKRMAERALTHCLTDARQLGLPADRGICHGVGGVLRTMQRVASDADSPAGYARHFEPLVRRYLSAAAPGEAGFLVGRAGAALAYQDADDATPKGQWDACLLLT
ncbi:MULTISPECIES: lanthionine synthetase C family protein [unclassified Streptomyces]|uniref:lanthionine synthetase C family protein n=1 Tax=unclassified Streptomyces TaxID=2593676 RepID=UPI000DABE352|nr:MULTISPECIES: lanthionine synthetase C family protein [unclassified Streptomyces]PZT77472.1 lanthionine synthetase [Streptomyces sp. AC1-42W]PZT78573.1 lanthionine synthetase [Streptomyces sp. AC1-42T]